MSDAPFAPRPRREILAPKHESLKEALLAVSEPMHYGEARLCLIPRDPHSLSAHWKLRPDQHPEAKGSDGLTHFFVRLVRDDGHIEGTTEIEPAAGQSLLPVTRPNAGYRAELGFFSAYGVWCFLACSGIAHTPPKGQDTPTAQNSEPFRPSSAPSLWSTEDEQRLARLLARDVAQMAQAKKKKAKSGRANRLRRRPSA